MTDDDPAAFELSRRKTLAALGTIGVASAGAGLGTSAYFSDQETFQNNQLTAGSLDLKVDWEEHYSDWSVDESEGLENDVLMSAPDEGDYVGLPDPQDPLIWVQADDLDTFMSNTSIEAFPDPNDDGVQGGPEFEYDACEDGADTPEDLDPTADGALRTLNEDTVVGSLENPDGPAPLINLNDVKPGDFGEATLSFHLCDNPGYVWLNGDLVEAAENGNTEPEADDPDEQGGTDEVITNVDDIDQGNVELLDKIQTTMWYDDDGDNVLDGGAGAAPCVQIVLDASGSMDATDGDGITRNQEAIDGAQQLAAEIINAGGQVGVTFFSTTGNDATVVQSVGSGDATDVIATQSAIANLPDDGGSTAIGQGILTADEDLANCPEGSRTLQVVVTDGQNNTGPNPSTAADNVTGDDTDDYTGEIFAIGTGGASESSLLQFARPSDDVHAEFADDLTAVIANLSQVILGEKVFFRGSLGEALQVLADGNGIPLDGNRATAFDEFEDDPSDRDCYVDSVEHFVGFTWYLPVNHSNEIQGDSVAFDLGFYTEQCRHNDGGGMNNDAVAANETDA